MSYGSVVGTPDLQLRDEFCTCLLPFVTKLYNMVSAMEQWYAVAGKVTDEK